MNAETAGHAGMPQLKQFHMVNIKTKFPRGILDQAISLRAHDGECERATGPGLKRQAPSCKPQAPSFKPQAQIKIYDKLQAPSCKPQASSHKPQAPRFLNHGTIEND